MTKRPFSIVGASTSTDESAARKAPSLPSPFVKLTALAGGFVFLHVDDVRDIQDILEDGGPEGDDVVVGSFVTTSRDGKDVEYEVLETAEIVHGLVHATFDACEAASG